MPDEPGTISLTEGAATERAARPASHAARIRVKSAAIKMSYCKPGTFQPSSSEV